MIPGDRPRRGRPRSSSTADRSRQETTPERTPGLSSLALLMSFRMCDDCNRRLQQLIADNGAPSPPDMKD